MLQQIPNARRPSTRNKAKREQRTLIQTVRGAIACLAEKVHDIDRRIESLTSKMPEAGSSFDVLAELGAGLRCVRSDLLADAVETLDALASLDDEALRQRFEERRQWLVDEGE